MTLEEIQQRIEKGEAKFVEDEPGQKDQKQPDPLQDFLQVLAALRKPKIHLTSAPTFTPKNFLEQIQFYDDEAGSPTRRIYIYVNNSWSYITLT